MWCRPALVGLATTQAAASSTAHRIDEAMRVSRATNVFGVLAHHVPIRGELLTDWQLRGLLARVERRLQGLSPTPCTRAALERARAAYRLLRVDVTQAAERQRLITEGLRPITTTLRCPVNVPVLQRYVERAGPEADVMPVGKAGQGTLRERAQRVVTAAGADGCITVSYRFSLLGAQLAAAGFVVSSREYAVPQAPRTPSACHEGCAHWHLLAVAMTWTILLATQGARSRHQEGSHGRVRPRPPHPPSCARRAPR